MKSLTNKQPDWLDYIPDEEIEAEEKSNFEKWKEVLNDDDIKYFNKVISKTTLVGNRVTFLGHPRYIHHNVYATMLNEPTWNKKQKRQFTTYIMQKYKSIKVFNDSIKKVQEAIIYDNNGIRFYEEDKQFNLIVSFVDRLDPKVYALPSRECKKVEFICSLHDNKAKKLIFNYIKLNLSLDCLNGVKSEQKIYDAFIDEVSRGYHRANFSPMILSNNKNEYCFAYIPLTYDKIGKTVAWDQFMYQIINEDMKKAFMIWIYGLFVAKDLTRTVLWLEGPSQCGKTTIVNALADYLRTFDPQLVGTLAKSEDRFTLAALANARLVIYSDANDANFFRRKDVLNLTGNDIVYYEEKHKNAESRQLFAKIFVTSNYEPVVSAQADFETSRLLRIKIDRNKATKLKKSRTMTQAEFGQKLIKELPFFLAKCKGVYEQYNSK